MIPQFFLQTLHAGHFLDAWRAPAGPEIDEHDFTAVVCERVGFAFDVDQAEVPGRALEGLQGTIGAGQQWQQACKHSRNGDPCVQWMVSLPGCASHCACLENGYAGVLSHPCAIMNTL